MHEDKEVEEQEDVGDLDNIESSEEMYGIQVNLVQNIEVTPLLRLKTDSAPVSLFDAYLSTKLRYEKWIEALLKFI